VAHIVLLVLKVPGVHLSGSKYEETNKLIFV